MFLPYKLIEIRKERNAMKPKLLIRVATFTLLNLSVALCAFGPSMNPMMEHDADPMFQAIENTTGIHAPAELTELRSHND